MQGKPAIIKRLEKIIDELNNRQDKLIEDDPGEWYVEDPEIFHLNEAIRAIDEAIEALKL